MQAQRKRGRRADPLSVKSITIRYMRLAQADKAAVSNMIDELAPAPAVATAAPPTMADAAGEPAHAP